MISRYFPDQELSSHSCLEKAPESKTKGMKPTYSRPWIGTHPSAHSLVLCSQSANFLAQHSASPKILQYPLPWLCYGTAPLIPLDCSLLASTMCFCLCASVHTIPFPCKSSLSFLSFKPFVKCQFLQEGSFDSFNSLVTFPSSELS